ncbi:MAG TPA: cbb3-type cytochrome c oxidase subunit 3 [Burkholderiaceae bacterium]|nr:cbb3-type cytochrome c oxidase subunit 3 [Burkholderiaceae bacterium]
MTFDNLVTDAHSAFTLISFLTFIGIMWWAFSKRRNADFEAAAQLPFADDMNEMNTPGTEKHNV